MQKLVGIALNCTRNQPAPEPGAKDPGNGYPDGAHGWGVIATDGPRPTLRGIEIPRPGGVDFDIKNSFYLTQSLLDQKSKGNAESPFWPAFQPKM